jgi:hypothetical protein
MPDLMHLPDRKPQSYRPRPGSARSRLRELAVSYLDSLDTARNLGAAIEQEVVAAQAAGSTLTQLSEASGLTVSQLEYLLVAAECQRRLPAL